MGDTLTHADRPADEPLPGYREAMPMVFCGLFPIEGDDYPDLKDALEKLSLNDASLHWEPETSKALGFGFRCGFLGLLHMEIVRERLEREFGLELLATTPNVRYEIEMTNGEVRYISQPGGLPRPRADRRGARAVHRGQHPRARASSSAPSWSLTRRSGARSRTWSTSRPTGCGWPTTCPWPRSCSTSSTC